MSGQRAPNCRRRVAQATTSLTRLATQRESAEPSKYALAHMQDGSWLSLCIKLGVCQGGYPLSCLYAPLTYKSFRFKKSKIMAVIKRDTKRVKTVRDDRTAPWRIDNTSVNTGSSFELNEMLESLSGGSSSSEQSTYDLRAKIESSQIYTSAYSLFSKLSDKLWLQRLQAIVSSVVGASETWFDSIGATNKYNDKMQAIEAEAYSQIQKLITEYQQYKQELPVTQVDDFADAGINSAITGQGVDGASISGLASNRDLSPYQMESTNPLESITSIGNLLFSSNGLLGALQVFNQIGVSKKTLSQTDRMNQWSIQKDLMELGFSSFPMSSSVEDFDSWWNTHGLNEARDLNIGKSTVNKLRSRVQYYSGSEASNELFDIDEQGSQFLSDKGQSIVNKMVDFEIDTWQKSVQYKNTLAKYNELYQATLDPERMANLSMDKESLQKELLSLQKHLQSLNNELMDARNNAIKQWIDDAGSDVQARAIIARVLMNVSPTESVQLNDYGRFSAVQQTNNYLSPVGTLTGAISNLPLL